MPPMLQASGLPTASTAQPHPPFQPHQNRNNSVPANEVSHPCRKLIHNNTLLFVTITDTNKPHLQIYKNPIINNITFCTHVEAVYKNKSAKRFSIQQLPISFSVEIQALANMRQGYKAIYP